MENVLHEDEYFSAMLFLHTKRFVYLNDSLYHRRYRALSTMTDFSIEQKVKSYNSYSKIYRTLEKEFYNPRYNLEQKRFIKRRLIAIYDNLISVDSDDIEKKNSKSFKSINSIDKLYLQVVRKKNYISKLVKTKSFF